MVRCTIYAQICVRWGKDNINLHDPAMVDVNSAVYHLRIDLYSWAKGKCHFDAPRNGGRKWYGVPFTHRYVYAGDRIT